MLLINGSQREGDSLAQAYLHLKDKLIGWENALKNSEDERARRVASEISAYIDSASGAKRFASLVDVLRAYAGKWQ